MPRILPIVLTQDKIGNISAKSPNKIWQIVYSLYRVKEITSKCKKAMYLYNGF